MKIIKRIVSGIASAAICLTTIAASFTMTASAAVGDTYIAVVGSKLTNTGAGDLSYGADAVYPITASKTGESLRVFCVGYMKPITNHNYIEVAKTASYFSPAQRKAINAVCHYGYATHKNDTYYIATQALIWDIVTNIPANNNLTPRNPNTLEFQGRASNTQYSYRYIATSAYSNAAACAAAYDSILANAKAYLTARPTASINKNSTKTYTLKYNTVEGYKNKYAVSIPLSELKVYSEENVSSFATGCNGKVNCTLSGSNYILWINPEAVKSFGTKTIDYNRVFASDPIFREFHNASGSAQQPFVYAEKRDPMSETVRLNAQLGEQPLSLKKVSSDGKFISGITFRVVGNGIDKTATTNATGDASFGNLPLGTYTVSEVETTVNKAYGVASSQTVVLDTPNTTKTVTFSNTLRYGEISISKVDDLGNVVPNVKFNIINKNSTAVTYGGTSFADGEVVATITTDANGKASISNLPFVNGKGKYIVKETGEYNPYIVTEQEQTVEFDTSNWGASRVYETKNYTFTNNVQRATLNIVKVDGSTNQPIKNNPATFSIKVAEDYIVGNKTVLTKGTDIGTFKTNNNGVLKVENIYVNAKYTVTETIPPQNYKKVAPITVTAAWDKTVEHVTKEQPIGNDWQSGSINVFKYVKKAGTNRPLANAVFELKAAEDVLNPDGTVKYAKGKVIQSNVKTDAEGKASFTRVPVGFEYTVRETAAPTGYQNKHPQTKFKLEWNKDVEFVETDPVSIENKPINLYISKRILAESDDTKHINGTELKGAKMTIIAEDGTTFASWTSDGSEHLVEQIPAGKYKLVEITQPDGFIVATSIEFEIDDQNAVTVTDATVESKDDLPVIVMFDAVTHVDISKQDATTGSELAGAKLTLYDDKNNKVDEWTSTTKPHTIYGLVVGKTYRLHEDLQPLGYRKASDVKFTVEGRLENGKAKVQKVVMKDEVQVGGLEIYKKTPEQKNIANIEFRLKGTSTLGIEVDETARTDANGVAKFENIPVGKFTLTENGKTVNTEVYIVADPQNVEIKDDEIAKINIDNIEKEGTIQVQKRTEGNLNIEGIEFTLAGTSDSGRDIEIKGKTDKDGLCTFKNIPVGTYTITESDGTHFAYLVAEPQKVTVLYAQQTDVEFFNKEKEGTIQVQKRTEGNHNIEGIKFILTGKSDSGREIKVEATTDKDGVAKFSVPCGVYTITEDAESVPFAYMVAEPKSDVKVVYAQQTDVEFFNELKKGSIKVQKKTKDMTNIEGITFTLSGKSDAGTDVNITGKTDANGVVEFKDIPIGTYKITESDVPAGYLVAEPQSVKVEYAQTVETTFINEEKPEQPPQTGFNGGNSTTIMLLLIGIGAISCGAFIGKRKEDK